MRKDLIAGAFSAVSLHAIFIVGGDYFFGATPVQAAPQAISVPIRTDNEPEPPLPEPPAVDTPDDTQEQLPLDLIAATLVEPPPTVHVISMVTQYVTPQKHRPPGTSIHHLIPPITGTHAPPSPANDGVLDILSLDSTPSVRVQVQPAIPLAFKRKGEAGEVLAELVVNASGKVESVSILRSTHRELEAPCMDALYKWVFTSGLKDGKPVPFKMRQPLRFSLN